MRVVVDEGFSGFLTRFDFLNEATRAEITSISVEFKAFDEHECDSTARWSRVCHELSVVTITMAAIHSVNDVLYWRYDTHLRKALSN